MKQVFSIILILFTTALFSQSKKTLIPVKRSQLIEMTLLSELVGGLPVDKSNFLYEVMGKMDGKLCSTECRGPQLCVPVKVMLQKAVLNAKIYIIVLTADGKTKLKDVAIKVIE